MIKDGLSFLLWLGAGLFCFLGTDFTVDGSRAQLLLLGLFCVLSDALLLTSWGRTSSRLAPILGLALILEGPAGFMVASLAFLGGGTVLVLHGTERRKMAGDLLRTLAPLSALSAGALDLPAPLPQLALIFAYLFLSVALEPRRYSLRSTLLGLLCAPWLALACHSLGSEQSWSLLLLLPLLIGLSRGKDEAFPLLLKLRKALQQSQQQTKMESEKARRFHHLLQAANLMARSLKPEDLRRALVKAAQDTGAQNVRVFLPGEARQGPPGLPLLGGKASLTFAGEPDQSQRDQLEILGRVFSTCWENADLHQQVVVALEETKRSQAQLVESSRLRAMGLMAAGVAHEVNTPLGAIQLSSELIEACLSKKPEEIPKHLSSIERATERAQKAVQRILYYARPIGEAQKESFFLNEVLEDALDLLSHRIERSKTRVHLEVDPELHLTGERQAFFSLLFNLILNAVDATHEREEPTLWLRAGATEQTIVLEVEDNGPGVPSALSRQIFEPFFTTRASGEGSGLGLHLARQAAESFGGRLDLVAGRGRGAIFRAEVPLCPEG